MDNLMRKNIKRLIILLTVIFAGINLITFNTEATTENKGFVKKDTYNDYPTEYKVNTFDLKTIIPEITVILVAGGVLLFCITKES